MTAGRGDGTRRGERRNAGDAEVWRGAAGEIIRRCRGQSGGGHPSRGYETPGWNDSRAFLSAGPPRAIEPRKPAPPPA
jgi:hypothetical protein